MIWLKEQGKENDLSFIIARSSSQSPENHMQKVFLLFLKEMGYKKDNG
jgi:hypothetical protein